MPYRPQIKTANGMVDFPLDAETIKGKTILEQTYPVGSIYLSVNNTSPASLFGGTWEQLKDKFLLAAGDTYSNGATGGNTTHKHSSDTMYADIGLESDNASQLRMNLKVVDWRVTTHYIPTSAAGTNTGMYYNKVPKVVGDTTNVSNMPPYLVVYMWKRIA